MGLNWHPWSSVSDGRSTPGAPIAAVPWEGSFALFASDPLGGIYAIKAVPGYGWKSVPGLTTKPGAPITALLSGNQFTLFTTNASGEIFMTSGVPYQDWDAWTPVSEGQSTPGASIAAIPWEGSFALFLSDPQGGIYAIKAVPGYGWESVPGLTTKPGAPVTALLSGNQFTLFIADVNGQVFMTSGAPYQGWAPWSSVSQGSSTPGAPIAAVPWEGSFALFLSDPQGGIYGIKATPGYGWESVPGRNTKPGGQITAVPWIDGAPSASLPAGPTRLLLFMADVGGEIFMTSGVPYQGWDPWTSVSQGSSTPGAPVTVTPNPATTLFFTLFTADPSGGVYTTSPASPPSPTGLHLISLSAQGGPGNSEALLGYTTVPPSSPYRINYSATIHDASDSETEIASNTYSNEVNVILTDGHTYSIYVQASYVATDGKTDVGLNFPPSAPSNTIVVTAPLPTLTPSVSATVVGIDNPTFGFNYGLLIVGSNFAKSEQVSVTVTWSVDGHGSSVFPQGVITTAAFDGSFSTTFTGNTPAGVCPIDVGLGQSQPAQNFDVTVTELSSSKTFSAKAGPFVCPP
jgi:hypothetical protein